MTITANLTYNDNVGVTVTIPENQLQLFIQSLKTGAPHWISPEIGFFTDFANVRYCELVCQKVQTAPTVQNELESPI